MEIRINVERFAESAIERKNYYNLYKITENKIRLINASKLYKKGLLKIQSIKRFNIEKQMRKLITSDPKAFYKILKQPNKTYNLPPLDDLSRCFQNLNKGETDENEMQLNLNSPLTQHWTIYTVIYISIYRYKSTCKNSHLS